MHVLPVVLLLAKVQTYYLNRYWIYRGLSKTCRAIVVELDPERGKEVEAEKGELHHIWHVSGEFPKSTFSEESNVRSSNVEIFRLFLTQTVISVASE
jgi:hypothetical protein